VVGGGINMYYLLYNDGVGWQLYNQCAESLKGIEDTNKWLQDVHRKWKFKIVQDTE
jgi:hypothetical protein